MWLKQCHKLAMTGNGKFIPPIKMVMTGGWFMTLFLTTLWQPWQPSIMEKLYHVFDDLLRGLNRKTFW